MGMYNTPLNRPYIVDEDEGFGAGALSSTPATASITTAATSAFQKHRFTTTVFAVCPICGMKLTAQQSIDIEVIYRGLGDHTFALDFEEHFRKVPHTDAQWRQAYFLDPSNGGHGSRARAEAEKKMEFLKRYVEAPAFSWEAVQNALT
jgi:hypothetical protein